MRLLIVDDEPTILDIMRRHLVACGHDVVAVSDGTDAIAAWEGAAFDALVSDIQLPSMTGIEVIGAIRKAGDRVPCLLISGHVRDALNGDHGLDPVMLLPKPFTMDELERALASVVASSG